MNKETILHAPVCPICEQAWVELMNDLERLAHLIVCARMAQVKAETAR